MTKLKGFTQDFEDEAVRLARTSGRTRRETAENLGVGLSTLTRWIARSRDRRSAAHGNRPSSPRRGGRSAAVARGGRGDPRRPWRHPADARVKPVRKQAADGDTMRDILRAVTGDSPRAVRDRALLAIGMPAALRRSELVALTLADVAVVPKGLRLTVNQSKTDQQGEGVEIAIPEGRRLAPKTLLLAWITLAGLADGPIFRKLTQRRITATDVRPRRRNCRPDARGGGGVQPALLGGHSLRAGFLTEAARQGASVFKMR